jgi:diguanylate cyclase (GGDEF)-like protein
MDTDSRRLVDALRAENARLRAELADREARAAALEQQLERVRTEAARLAQQHRQAVTLAETDPLTGLANRRAWDAELAARVEAVRAGARTLCVALMDLDHFKQLNDAAGHAAGDAALRAAAERLRSGARSGDLVARLGGDEFGLALSDLDQATARRVVERLRERMAGAGAEPADGAGPRVSAGAVFVPAGTVAEAAELLDTADRALRRAKGAGRDRSAWEAWGGAS